MTNAPTTRINKFIGSRTMVARFGTNHVVIARSAEVIRVGDNAPAQGFIVTCQLGDTSPYQIHEFFSIQELANFMRGVYDLRKWTIE